MLILSQDKETILNFNNAVTLYVIRDSFSEEKGLENYNIDYSTNDEINYVLGTYATRERAKEILQEIMGKYEFSCRMKYRGSTMLGLDNYFLYKMPKN